MELLARVLERVRSEPSRTPSVIVTLFGDAILPRGGEVWLGTLFEVFRRLGVGDGVVRTAMSRLAADGWVERRRAGRNSFYALSPGAADESSRAGRVIYGKLPEFGEASLEMVLEPFDRAALLARGFVQLAPGVLVSPRGGAAGLTISGPDQAARSLVARLWPLDETAALYDRFRTMIADTNVSPGIDGLEALSARTLLIHEWRRVILRDPRLPGALLPQDWPAHEARAACARLYQALLPMSEAWLDAHAVTSTGPLPPADAALQRRFAA